MNSQSTFGDVFASCPDKVVQLEAGPGMSLLGCSVPVYFDSNPGVLFPIPIIPRLA